MTHGALFNGIAGFPLAGRWAGIETLWTVEIDEFCNKVSKKHFPNAIQYTDIHECHNLPYVDIISGGFPCQPFSVAGKQLGNEDDRALWPQMLRVIREVKPAYVIGENVTGIINLALDEVLASLEAEGYTTETFVVPAAGVGAPHRRDRVWIVAYANDRQRIRQEQALCSRGGMPLALHVKLLPTPTASTGGSNNNSAAVRERGHGTNLRGAIAKLLPTPTTNDAKNAALPESQRYRDGLAGSLLRGELLPTPTNSTATVQDMEQSMYHSSKRPEYSQCQSSGSLNPRFVAQMMGYPPDWCEIEQHS